jgi:hypothetical protein
MKQKTRKRRKAYTWVLHVVYVGSANFNRGIQLMKVIATEQRDIIGVNARPDALN